MKKALKELGFLVGVILAIILTLVDIVFGIGRYLYGRLRGRPNFNPWKNIQVIWKAIGYHFIYLFRLVQPSFRESVRRNREAMHRRAMEVREAFRRSRNIRVFDDFDYADGIDVATFFVMLPYSIVIGVMLVQMIVSTITVISVYGLYKTYQTTPTLPKTPQKEVVVPYQPQVADVQEMDFGPTWLNRGEVLDKVSDPGFLNVAIISDTGTIKYSETKVVLSDGFTLLPFSERIVNPYVTATGQVHFLDQYNHEFTINKLQAFLCEGYASKVFMFNNDGQLMGIDSKAAKLR